MKITYITTKAASLKSGSEVRNYHLLKSLLSSPKVSEVSLIYIHYDAHVADIEVKSSKLNTFVFQLPKRNVFKSIAAYAWGEAPYISHLIHHPFIDEVIEILSGSDELVISELDGYFVAKKAIQRSSFNNPIIFDCHNVDHMRFSSEISLGSSMKQALGKRLIENIKKHEIEALNTSTKVLACSKIDEAIFANFVPKEKIKVIPNGASLSKANVAEIKSHNILFMGLLSYQPNSDGLAYYLNEVHPKILKECPDAVVNILGRNPPDWLVQKSSTDSSIKVLGFVENLSEVFDQSFVCICPLRYGSGTRLKVLEYMAAGKPVVSTTIGAEGIDITDKKNILIADRPDDFARSVLNLMADDEVAFKIGSEARKLIQQHYDWEKIGDQFVKIVSDSK